jgi:hypothetical protein
MPVRSNDPSADRRCGRCGATLDLSHSGLVARLLAQWPGRRCLRCREAARASSSAIVVTPAEGQQDPVSLFMPETVMQQLAAERASQPPPSAVRRSSVLPAAAPRPLVLAFSLGLAVGAAPLAWQMAFDTTSSPSTVADAAAIMAPAGVSAGGGSSADPGTATVLLSSNPRGAVDRFLPPSPSAESAARSTAPPRRTAAARPRINTVRYRGNKSAPFRGSLAVNTTPSGVRVSLDGTPLGSTPIRIDGVPAGSHVLGLETEGRRIPASAVQVVANRTTRVARTLERNPSGRPDARD